VIERHRPNGARYEVHPSFGRDSAFLSRPKGRGGAKQSRDAGSDVSFIEQIGGAGTEPSCRFKALRRFDPILWLDSSAAWRLDVISRTDMRRDLRQFEAQRVTQSLSALFGECSRRSKRRLSSEITGRRKRSF
jgi:hypothetical protein